VLWYFLFLTRNAFLPKQYIYTIINDDAHEKVENINTKQSNKRNNQNSKDKRQDYNMKKGDTNERTK